jgi:hypothetical protein
VIDIWRLGGLRQEISQSTYSSDFNPGKSAIPIQTPQFAFDDQSLHIYHFMQILAASHR